MLQRQIAAALTIPPHFLGKILQLLSRRGLLISRKGKTGGFLLGPSPKEISLRDVVEAVDGVGFLDTCVLGFTGCGDEHPCPVHPQWKEAKGIVLEMLTNRTVEELSAELDTT